MNWWGRLFRTRRLEQQLDAELRFHIQQAVADGVRSGLSEGEARRRANIELGGFEQVKEECREVRGVLWLETTLQDLRFAWRTACRSPGFAAATIGTLALGIGATTAIFSVVNAVFLRPLPYAVPERIAWVTEHNPKLNNSTLRAPDYAAWKRQNTTFDRLSAYRPASENTLIALNQPAARVKVGHVTPEFFAMLGVQPRIGRDFESGESETGRNRVVIVSDSLWRNFLHASSDVLGKSILLDGSPHVVIGVMPAGFVYPVEDDAALWAPDAVQEAHAIPSRGPVSVCAIGRLRPGVTVEQARADLEVIARRMDGQYPNGSYATAHAASFVRVVPLQDQLTSGSRTPIFVLAGAVGCILLIVCANVANLFLARSVAREREMGIRAAMGASRLRLVRLLLAEGLMLGCAGGLVGALVAWWGAPALGFLLPGTIPQAVSADLRVLFFAASCSLAAGALFGLAPSLAASRLDVNTALKEGGRRPLFRPGGLHSQRFLAIAQLTLCLALLVGAGLLMRSFLNLLHVSPGLDARNVLLANVALGPEKLYSPTRKADFFRRALAAVKAMPGVESAAVTSDPPMGAWASYVVGGLHADGEAEAQEVLYMTSVSTEFFRALRVPLLQGRPFRESDGDGPQRVAIISGSAARLIFGNRNPLGRRITARSRLLPFRADEDVWLTVVGVVGDIRHDGLNGEVRPEVYQPYAQAPMDWICLVVRGYSNPSGLAPAIRGALRAIDYRQPVFGVEPLQRHLSNSAAQHKRRAFLLGAFAFVSLAVAVVGVYGVVAYSVARRTHEIGVRVALGAGRGDVLSMVVGEGLSIAVVGMAAGVALSLGLTRLFRSLLFGVGPHDFATFAGVCVALTAATGLASYIPARRAAHIDPIRALRAE